MNSRCRTEEPITPAQQRRYEAQVAELIRTGKIPTLDQVRAAIETTKQKYVPLILAARAGSEAG